MGNRPHLRLAESPHFPGPVGGYTCRGHLELRLPMIFLQSRSVSARPGLFPTINLIEWRMGHVRNIECTFTATLQSGKATRNLGVFHDMVFRWMEMPGRLGLAESFGQAAEGAISQLYRDLAETELVPGLRRQSQGAEGPAGARVFTGRARIAGLRH